jgi:magnesium-protoporphyrin O-methyltransferase
MPMVFDRKRAAKELTKYRQEGPAKTTRILLRALKAEGVEGKTLLDIGGGVGTIQHELLKAGVTRAVSVEVSTAYIDAAGEETERQGYSDRVRFLQGDFVSLASDVAPADIVTLDRVICCYHDMQQLVTLSAARAEKLYGVVYPRDAWWVRAGIAIENLVFRMGRNPFRLFVHPTDAVEAALRTSGLERRFYRQTPLWQVVVFAR